MSTDLCSSGRLTEPPVGTSPNRSGRPRLTPVPCRYGGFSLACIVGEPMATLLPNMSLKGKETIGSREACALEAALPQGPPAKLWFDTQTGLLVRIQYAFNGRQFQLDLDDYHDIGGLKLPFKLRQR